MANLTKTAEATFLQITIKLNEIENGEVNPNTKDPEVGMTKKYYSMYIYI